MPNTLRSSGLGCVAVLVQVVNVGVGVVLLLDDCNRGCSGVFVAVIVVEGRSRIVTLRNTSGAADSLYFLYLTMMLLVELLVRVVIGSLRYQV